MATQTYPVQTGMFFIGGPSDRASRQLGWTVAVSLLLHLCVVVFVAGIRFVHTGEQPLASVQVSLVSLPAMPKPVEASPSKPTPVPAPSKPAKPAIAPAPAARREAPGIRRAAGDVMRDVLRGIELPPDAAQFGDLSPSKPVAAERSNDKLRKEVDSLLGKLNVPELRTPPMEQAKPVPVVPDRSSFADEADRELEKELKKLQTPPLARKTPEPVKLQPQEVPTRPTPAMTAKVPSMKAPDTVLKVPGSSSGSNQYLARVQAMISSRWTAPPVDVSGQSLTVVIRFRLDRFGKVSGVTVERSSGNEYYDVAGQRAVMSASPLPVFPPDMTDSSLDAHFTFSVGEQAG